MMIKCLCDAPLVFGDMQILDWTRLLSVTLKIPKEMENEERARNFLFTLFFIPYCLLKWRLPDYYIGGREEI